MNQRQIQILGWVASAMSILMYVSYIAQIINNRNGQKGSWIQPAVAFVNCILWTIYALKTKPMQKAIAAANIPGIFLAAATVLTSF